jgi:EmrB/QacA subfamily drug resistance transporter
MPAREDQAEPLIVERPPLTTEAAFRLVFPGVMVSMFLAAVDQTILATALPVIASALGNVADLSWVVVGYLLAATIAAPIYGHLGDSFGRRRMLLTALALFTLASLACAAAPTFGVLVAARVLQGLGGGGLMTLAQAIIGENVPPRERGRFQGYFAAVFALSSTSGPVLGAYLTEHLSWRAIFALNLPLGVVAAVLALRIPGMRPARAVPFRPDVAGALLFAASTVCLLVALTSIGHRLAWTSPVPYAMLLAAAGGYAALLRIESRHDEPLLPVRFLHVPAIARSDLTVFLFAAALFGSIVYLPLYLQLGRGMAVGESGLLLLPITLSMVVASTTTGRMIARTGRVAIYPIAGLVLASAALLALATLLPHLPTGLVLAATVALGMGLGTVMAPTQITVQHAAGKAALGSATATIALSRSIGGAVGVAVTGAVLFLMAAHGSGGAPGALQRVLQGGSAYAASLSPSERSAMAGELDSAFRVAFALLACFTGAGAIVATTVPRPQFR